MNNMGRMAWSHSGILAVTVRTDTDRRCSVGVSRGCVTPVLCGRCGLPLRRCKCLDQDYGV